MSPRFAVRRATRDDTDEIAAAHLESIATLGAAAYDEEIVREWGASCIGARYAAAMDRGEQFFVATRGTETLGFSSYRVEDGRHRTAIYVVGRAARIGVGTALFRAAEGAAIASDAKEVHVDASLGAVEFYRANGFEALARGEHPMKSGRLMACVFMRKILQQE